MTSNGYEFLEARPGNVYRQLFVKGRRLTAEQVYRATVGAEPRTPEQVASDFGLPLRAVLEAIDYACSNEELLRRERAEDAIRIAVFEKKYPPLAPQDAEPRL